MPFTYKKTAITATAFTALCILALILAFPKDSFEAAASGLNIWLKVVFPSLLPFFIGSEVMIGLGMVDFISVLLQPVMRPLFRCPGHSSFIWAMSVTSGYPMGAKLTASFRQQGRISRVEGQRILSFCSTSGPLFMIGAVGIGLLGSTRAGELIAFSHYLAAVLIGLLFRFYGGHDNHTLKEENSPRLSNAFKQLYKARERDGRTLGELLGDAVRNSVNTLLLIGGFIILFSVIIDLLIKIGLISLITQGFMLLLSPLGFDTSLFDGLSGGIFEVTVGCKLLSQASAPLAQKIVISCFLIGWSGFSIHGQAATFISKTDLSIGLYFLTKLFHGILSAIIAFFSIQMLHVDQLEVFNPQSQMDAITWLNRFSSSAQLFIVVILCFFASAIIFNIIRSFHSRSHF